MTLGVFGRALVVVVVSAGATVACADEPGPVLRIPGFPAVPLPPGTHVYGPGQGGGVAPPSGQSDIFHDFAPGNAPRGLRAGDENAAPTKPSPAKPPPAAPTPEQKRAQIRKALTPAPPLALARRKTLDNLYAQLAAATEEGEARRLAATIGAVWMHSGSDTAALLVARAESAAATRNYPVALKVLDDLVRLQPTWAEAWNKRATVRYLAGDLNGSMADIGRVLKLEPKHFAALNGMAMILKQTGFDKQALQVYRRELAIYPHQAAIERLVEQLSAAVEGQGI